MTGYKTELCVIASQVSLVEELMQHLQFVGIGGKRSSGLGGFRLRIEEVPTELMSRLSLDSNKPVMLLNDAMAKDEELDRALSGANYLLERSGGYAYSAVETPYRKQDLYKFKAGSTFKGSFEGAVFDVAPDEFEHSVYQYAKPLFYELEG